MAAITVAGLTVVPGAPAAAAPPVDVITRIAGNANGSGGVPAPGTALNSGLNYPYQIDRDASGNLYFVDYGSRRVVKVTPAGVSSMVAGNGSVGPIVEGTATGTPFQGLQGLARDTSGNIYLADPASRRVVKVDPSGQLSYFAGNGSGGTITPGPARNTPVPIPFALTTDPAGNVFIANSIPSLVLKVTPAGTLSVFAGTGSSGTNVPGPATSSPMAPNNLATDASGNVYIADTARCTILKVTPAQQLTIVAGNASCNGTITPGDATATTVRHPNGLDVDPAGNIYASNWDTGQIVKITPAGALSLVAGNGTYGNPTYDGPALASAMKQSEALVVNDAGVLYVSHSDHNTVDRIGPATPSAPRDVQVTANGGTLTVSFLPPVDAGTTPVTGYEISTDGGSSWAPVTVTPAGGRLTATVPGSPSGQVQVRAVNSSGASNAGSGTVAGPGAPGQTVGLPITGTAISVVVTVGVVLLTIGIGLVRAGRRRRTALTH